MAGHGAGSASNLGASAVGGDPRDGSLAEMAQRDLDAALQLLADRAQYITGASGAAIALRREGKNDLLCRATTGENAPELGALFSTEWGLSGESVRTRQALRCDDAESDARVNREVCREMGIASVVVMPVVNDDEVLGVFELFSGKANAFGTRDVSAVERLSVMVETAVRLARASQNLVLKREEAGEEPISAAEVVEDLVLERAEPVVDIAVEGSTAGAEAPVSEAPVSKDSLIAALEAMRPLKAEANAAADAASTSKVDAKVIPVLSQSARKDGAVIVGAVIVDAVPAEVAAGVEIAPEAAAPKKALFWSAAVNSVGEAASAEQGDEQGDESCVPPMLRSLRKCAACGFPVSAGRALCVECEEKKWRGQSLVPKVGAAREPVVAAATAVQGETRAFAAAAGVRSTVVGPSLAAASRLKPAEASTVISASEAEWSRTIATSEFVLSAGLEPEQSWLSRNRYMVGVLLAAGAAAAAVFFLR